jgi:hypothetical protein
MFHNDLVGHMIARVTGRSVDQHMLDPIPAAANLPPAAVRLRHVRHELLLAVDQMRTTLINGDDLQPDTDTDTALRGTFDHVADLVRRYHDTRRQLDILIDDDEREEHAARTAARPVQRRYVKPGDTIIVVLPHTTHCRALRLAGRATRLRVDSSDVELDLIIGPGQLRLSHDDAGIHHDPDTACLYVVEPADPDTT